MAIGGGVTMGNHEDKILSSMENTGRGFYTIIGIAGLVVLWGVYAWATQFRVGLMTTGLNDTVIWGFYIATFVFMIGISHAGILISATVRVMRLEKYKPVARIAEVLTIVGLIMAVLSVVADLGRPDRLITLLFNIKLASPLSWDLVFISLYLVFSAFYLFISMKKDIRHITERFPGRAILYKTMNRVYDFITPEDDEKFENMLNWIALLILPFPIFGSGMVVAFIFSMLVARPAWNVPFLGPYFITAAVVSGVSTVVIIAAILRRVFNWEEVIPSEIILGLGSFLKVGIPFYAYFTFNEQFTIQYVREHAELVVSDTILTGQYASLFWGMVIFGFLVPEIILVLPRTRNLTGVFIASTLVTMALWVKRFIIVVPAMMYPNLPYDYGIYAITWVEWSVTAGIVALGVIIYAVFFKLFPIIELE